MDKGNASPILPMPTVNLMTLIQLENFTFMRFKLPKIPVSKEISQITYYKI